MLDIKPTSYLILYRQGKMDAAINNPSGLKAKYTLDGSEISRKENGWFNEKERA